MGLDILGAIEDINYKVEPYFNTAIATIVGGPSAGAATANYYYNRDREKKHKREQQQERDNYYVNMRKSAERGGINVLTALRAGGGMGYQYAGTTPFKNDNSLGNLISLMGGDYRRQVQREKLEIASLEAEIRLANMRAEDLLKRAIPNNSDNSGKLIDVEKVISQLDNNPHVQQRINDRRTDAIASAKTPPVATVFGMDLVGSGRFSQAEALQTSFGEGFVMDTILAPIYFANVIDAVGHSFGAHDWATRPIAPALEGVPQLPKSTFNISDFNIFNAFPKSRARHSGVFSPYPSTR